MVTDKLFTGQQEMAGLGIYNYRARFYSPYLNHFTQPDSIVPDPYNPQDWNRYSYARNNPLRYTDPTGHKPVCDGGVGEVCKPSYTIKDKINDTILNIKNRFKWNVKGKGWTLEEVETIYQTGRDIETYIDGLSGGKGRDWMVRVGGGTSISHCNVCEQSYSLPVIGILFEKDWDKRKDSHELLAHEFAHQWDISTGFSASQELRITYNKGNAPWSVAVKKGYGNTNSREYLAETFSWAIYDSTRAPSGVVSWLNDRISYETSFLP